MVGKFLWDGVVSFQQRRILYTSISAKRNIQAQQANGCLNRRQGYQILNDLIWMYLLELLSAR
jgi:hypothetical protein